MIKDFKSTRWATTHKLRATIDDAADKYLKLGLMVVGYFSEIFQTRRKEQAVRLTVAATESLRQQT
jgi:hypothetical protein